MVSTLPTLAPSRHLEATFGVSKYPAGTIIPHGKIKAALAIMHQMSTECNAEAERLFQSLSKVRFAEPELIEMVQKAVDNFFCGCTQVESLAGVLQDSIRASSLGQIKKGWQAELERSKAIAATGEYREAFGRQIAKIRLLSNWNHDVAVEVNKADVLARKIVDWMESSSYGRTVNFKNTFDQLLQEAISLRDRVKHAESKVKDVGSESEDTLIRGTMSAMIDRVEHLFGLLSSALVQKKLQLQMQFAGFHESIFLKSSSEALDPSVIARLKAELVKFKLLAESFPEDNFRIKMSVGINQLFQSLAAMEKRLDQKIKRDQIKKEIEQVIAEITNLHALSITGARIEPCQIEACKIALNEGLLRASSMPERLLTADLIKEISKAKNHIEQCEKEIVLRRESASIDELLSNIEIYLAKARSLGLSSDAYISKYTRANSYTEDAAERAHAVANIREYEGLLLRTFEDLDKAHKQLDKVREPHLHSLQFRNYEKADALQIAISKLKTELHVVILEGFKRKAHTLAGDVDQLDLDLKLLNCISTDRARLSIDDCFVLETARRILQALHSQYRREGHFVGEIDRLPPFYVNITSTRFSQALDAAIEQLRRESTSGILSDVLVAGVVSNLFNISLAALPIELQEALVAAQTPLLSAMYRNKDELLLAKMSIALNETISSAISKILSSADAGTLHDLDVAEEISEIFAVGDTLPESVRKNLVLPALLSSLYADKSRIMVYAGTGAASRAHPLITSSNPSAVIGELLQLKDAVSRAMAGAVHPSVIDSKEHLIYELECWKASFVRALKVFPQFMPGKAV